MDREWAVSADDVLWRRSKLGLRLDAAEAARLGDFMAEVRLEAVGPTASVRASPAAPAR
jgi:glycerol-3-phosphate dehydrogenase